MIEGPALSAWTRAAAERMAAQMRERIHIARGHDVCFMLYHLWFIVSGLWLMIHG